MPCVYVLKNLNNKKLCIGLTDDFGGEFEKHLKSKKGLADFKLKMKNKALGIMD